ncbi:chemotaxis protein CheA [Shewanella surugensis]|uniref:histidine kinase n=1 Tax=Shewanella surugensis TaxID=212020 RepID=A0ABT0L9N2_9GAMM|nr:chemotaxis protein CheA [Shewanella surugensis]MCL1123861.1 chemotaxis protein CheA [Shewanella surugensis]
MSFDVDEEILQDFLIEAGEIIELLQEQLVALENNPDDTDLLNAIFRGFHTVKGGAGFLSLGPMVDVCHEAENTFDLLRTGQRQVSAELMDIILQAIDTINAMFAQTQAGQEQEPADAHLLSLLKQLSAAEPQKVTSSRLIQPENSLCVDDNMTALSSPSLTLANTSIQCGVRSGSIDDINQVEFEALLDALHGDGHGPSSQSTVLAAQDVTPAGIIEAELMQEACQDAADSLSSNNDITDDEFEALLDELQGTGPFSGPDPTTLVVSAAPVASDDITDDEFEALLDELQGNGSLNGPLNGPLTAASVVSAAPVTSDDITDDEFENLLDELHGSGKGPKGEVAFTAHVDSGLNSSVLASKEKRHQATESRSPLPKKAVKISSSKTETTVRVDTARLDQIMNMVGELVLVRNRLLSLGVARDDEVMSKALANLDLVTADLQGAVMKTRMQPIKKVFGRFPRVVRDLARSLNKDIELVMIGEETDLDKNLVEALADPLVHLVRNSVDHGIEMPDEREANGKMRTGKITLSASQEGDHILLKIEDDGAGMDPKKLKKIAVGRGVIDIDTASRMSDQDAYNLIFAPGFSTKVEISDISGRGVGMDVVKTRIAQLNGTIHIDSFKGQGTRLDIKVPLTLAIMPTLMVEVATQVFALPLSSVNEIFNLDLNKTNMVNGQLTVIVRNKAVPLFYLEHWLSRQPSKIGQNKNRHGHVVVVQLGTQQIGFVVDSLIGQEEVVIKPLGALLHGTAGMAGATITSDGGIALILDVPGLLKHYVR